MWSIVTTASSAEAEHGSQAGLARPHLLLGVPAGDELPHLAAEHAHRLEQPLVGLEELPGEELHHPDDPRGLSNGKPNAACKAGAPGEARPREVRVVRRVDDPRARPSPRPRPGRPSPGARASCSLSASNSGDLRRRARCGRSAAARRRSQLPHRADLPAERALPTTSSDRRVDLDRASVSARIRATSCSTRWMFGVSES